MGDLGGVKYCCHILHPHQKLHPLPVHTEQINGELGANPLLVRLQLNLLSNHRFEVDLFYFWGGTQTGLDYDMSIVY